jgi:hypothetical protein
MAASAALWVGLVLIAVLALWIEHSESVDPGQKPADRPTTDAAAPHAGSADVTSSHDVDDAEPEWIDARGPSGAAGSTLVENVTIRNRYGRIDFQGTVDLRPTLERIERGDSLPFAHDGSRFDNRERRLPHKPSGYYREYVHPTPGMEGPGPQRVVVGREGETYYTFDHYQTFRRIK